MILNLKNKLKQLSTNNNISITSITGEKTSNSTYELNQAEHIPVMIDPLKILSNYNSEYSWGGVTFNDLKLFPYNTICSMIKKPLYRNFNYEKVLFLDTETTGLSGGAGTFAFLIGVGFFYNNQFMICQFLMRDFPEEYNMLTQLIHMFNNFETLVTYNGKSFDLPLINSRLVMNKIKPSTKMLDHVDLLHPSRRIWKSTIGDCSLKSVEKNILDIERSNDIPGYLIPEKYQLYLQSGNINLLEDIIYHNNMDILSLVSIFSIIACRLKNPLEKCCNQNELYAIGTMFEQFGNNESAMQCYQSAMINHLNIKAMTSLSMLYKKNRDFDKAVDIWKSLTLLHCSSILPFVELAKYYEHQEKNYNKALTYTNQALRSMSYFGHQKIDNRETQLLQKRKMRLEGLLSKIINKR